MKQGNNSLLPIKVSGIDPELVESIRLKFQQGEVVRLVDYPSNEVTRAGSTLYVTWTPEQTFAFDPNAEIQLDARVKLNGSDYMPDVQIGRIYMMPTLFTRQEVLGDA